MAVTAAIALMAVASVAGFAQSVRADGGVAGREARDVERAAAERLATRLYYERVPWAEATRITPAGAERLTELLADPAAVAHHARALVAIGMAAKPGAFEALQRHAEARPVGEVSTAVFRARRSLRMAMGHLAHSDDRALAWLAAHARAPASDPGWSCGAMRGERLAVMLRQLAISGLGMAGRPEAEAVLAELAGPPSGAAPGAGPRAAAQATVPSRSFASALEEARALSAEIRSHGAARVLGRPLQRKGPR